MATVDPGYADWLRSAALYTTAETAGVEASFGDAYVDSSIITPFALQADAAAEAVRQANFLAHPIARDTHIVAGRRSDLIGQLVTLTIPRLGYDAGRLCLVIGATEDEARPVTTLTVISRLDA